MLNPNLRNFLIVSIIWTKIHQLFFIDKFIYLVVVLVRIGLYYTEQDDEPISCFVDIGLIEEGLRAAVFEKILVLNLEINGVNGESLGFSRNSGHLVLRANIQPESGCTAVQLARCLSDYVQFVHKLRTEILNDKEVHSDAFFLALV